MQQKVLIIEDEPDIRKAIATLLNEEGFIVFSAEGGEKGVAEAVKHLPDVIICDIMMQGLDGYGVLEKLSGINETRTIPFIYLTAKVERGDLRRGMELGADDYIFKPFKPEELLSAINARLQRRALLKVDLVKKNINSLQSDQVVNKIFLNLGVKSGFVTISQIVFIAAENQYTSVNMLDGRNLLIRKSVSYWEKTLPNANFVKINRSTIINLDFINKMGRSHNSSFVIYLKNITDPFVVSRRYSTVLRNRKFNK
jgi:DNA-binding response OmpR family regulator